MQGSLIVPDPPAHPLNALAAMLAGIARDAGDLLLKFRADGYSVTRKADGSPVTQADLASEALILAALAAAMPGCPVISEESAPVRQTGDIRRFLLVDPLDGTKGYLAGGSDFCVLIALIENGIPVAGAIDAPARGKTWWAGERAFESDDRRSLAGVAMQALPARAGPLIAAASLLHDAEESRALCLALGAPQILQENSALKFTLLARGEADIYPRPGRTMQWDVAAGHALLRALGGSLSGLDGAPLTYGSGDDGWAMKPFIARRIAPR